MANLQDFDEILRPARTWSLQHVYGMFCYSLLLNSENREFVNEYQKLWDDIRHTLFVDVNTCLDNFVNSDDAKSLDYSYQLDKYRWGYKRYSVYDDIKSMKEYLRKQEIFVLNNISSM